MPKRSKLLLLIISHATVLDLGAAAHYHLAAMKTITTSSPVYPPTDGGFVAWFQNGTDASRYWCGDDYTYDTASTASTLGRCCAPDEADCAPATRCDGITKVYADGDTVLCSATKSCVEATIYEDQQSSEDGDAVTMAACVRSPYPTAFYRTAITTFTTDVPDDFLSSSSISPPTATSTDSATDDTADDTEAKDSGPGKDKGAIIGGTIGGVAGLVLIILAAWYILRRHRAKRAEMREIGTTYVSQDSR